MNLLNVILYYHYNYNNARPIYSQWHSLLWSTRWTSFWYLQCHCSHAWKGGGRYTVRIRDKIIVRTFPNTVRPGSRVTLNVTMRELDAAPHYPGQNFIDIDNRRELGELPHHQNAYPRGGSRAITPCPANYNDMFQVEGTNRKVCHFHDKNQ